jgi:methyl-accepting chemotaxis protein
VQEITASSVEQSSGAEQINNAIQNLNNVVQENAATAEQLAAGAEELNSQSLQLQEAVAFFKIDGLTQHRPVSAMTAPRVQSVRPAERVHAGSKSNVTSTKVNINLGGPDALDNDFMKF